MLGDAITSKNEMVSCLFSWVPPAKAIKIKILSNLKFLSKYCRKLSKSIKQVNRITNQVRVGLTLLSVTEKMFKYFWTFTSPSIFEREIEFDIVSSSFCAVQ